MRVRIALGKKGYLEEGLRLSTECLLWGAGKCCVRLSVRYLTPYRKKICVVDSSSGGGRFLYSERAPGRSSGWSFSLPPPMQDLRVSSFGDTPKPPPW